MAAPSKAQLLTDVHALLKKHYKLGPKAERPSILEATIYGICHEGTTREQANQALSRFKDDFFDWNEVRVSSLDEIQGTLAGLPDAEDRAQRLRRFLRQLFEKTYGFALDGLTKKPLKDSIKALHDYEVFQSDYVLATVIQQALGGHAIPVDEPVRRALVRLGVADESTEPAALRAMLERAVPKNRGNEFVDLLEELTHDACVPGVPDCPRCDLRKLCPTGQARVLSDRAATKAAAKAVTAEAARAAKSSKAPATPAPAQPPAKSKAAPPPPPPPAARPSRGKSPRSK